MHHFGICYRLHLFVDAYFEMIGSFVGRRCVETLRRIFGLHLLCGRSLRQSCLRLWVGEPFHAFAVRRPDAQIQLNFGHLYFRILSSSQPCRVVCVLFHFSERIFPEVATISCQYEHIVVRKAHPLVHL